MAAGPGRADLSRTRLGPGSAAIPPFIIVEPFHGRRADMARGEKRFRIAFLATFASLVTVSIPGLQAWGAIPDEAWRIGMTGS